MLTDIEFRCTWSDGRHDNDVLLTNTYNDLIHGRSGKYLFMGVFFYCNIMRRSNSGGYIQYVGARHALFVILIYLFLIFIIIIFLVTNQHTEFIVKKCS